MCVCLVTQSCPTLFDLMDCSLPGSSVHRIFHARILEWVAICSFRGSSQPKDNEPESPGSPGLAGGILYHWDTWELAFLKLYWFINFVKKKIASHCFYFHVFASELKILCVIGHISQLIDCVHSFAGMFIVVVILLIY